MDGWMDEWTDGRTDERTDGLMFIQTDEQTVSIEALWACILHSRPCKENSAAKRETYNMTSIYKNVKDIYAYGGKTP